MPRRCTSPLRCYTTAAPALLAEVAGYGQRLIDYLFRGELHLALAEGEPRLDVVAVELPLGSGTVTLLGEQPEGRRRILRKVDTVPLKEVQPLTGYLRGGVTALAGKKDYPVYLDHSALGLPTISISAGVQGWSRLVSDSSSSVLCTRCESAKSVSLTGGSRAHIVMS